MHPGSKRGDGSERASEQANLPPPRCCMKEGFWMAMRKAWAWDGGLVDSGLGRTGKGVRVYGRAQCAGWTAWPRII